MAYDGAMTVSERIERVMEWLDSEDKPQFVTVSAAIQFDLAKLTVVCRSTSRALTMLVTCMVLTRMMRYRYGVSSGNMT